MINPTVGRVVWYWQNRDDDQPHAAIVAYVWHPRMVNLMVIDHNGNPFSRTSVPLLQDGDERPEGFFCEWMAYQKGQAAKTEELERKLAG